MHEKTSLDVLLHRHVGEDHPALRHECYATSTPACSFSDQRRPFRRSIRPVADELAAAAAAAREALAPLPSRFTDGCASCPLFRHCRDEAELHRSTARLGAAVAGACGNVTDINAALDLAERRRVPADASETAVAAALARGVAAARLATGGLA